MKTKLHAYFKIILILCFLSSSLASAGISVHDPERENSIDEKEKNPACVDPVLKDFSLVNADTDEELFVIDNREPILQDDFKNTRLNIKANTHDGVGNNFYVVITKTSVYPRVSRRENLAPYAFFGDLKGDYNGEFLEEGSHSFQATAYDRKTGNKISTISVTLEFTNSLKVDSFEVSPDTSGSFLRDSFENQRIENNSVFDNSLDRKLPPFAQRATIWVNSTKKLTGSVRITINGPINYSRIENEFPYVLFGDKEGKFNYRYFPPGEYTLSATPYSQDNAEGFEGVSKTVNFVIAGGDSGVPRVNSFVIASAGDGGNFDRTSTLQSDKCYYNFEGADKNIVVSGNIATKSVLMELKGALGYKYSIITNDAPYVLFRRIDGQIRNRQIPHDTYTVTVTPYSEPDGKGVKGESNTKTYGFGCPNLDPYSVNILNAANPEEKINMRPFTYRTTIPIIAMPELATITVSETMDKFSGIPVESVKMSIEGPISYSRIENVEPFTLFGDIPSKMNGRDFPLGEYIITLTPYSKNDGKGIVQNPFIFRLELVGDAGLTYVPDDKFERALVNMGFDNRQDNFVLTKNIENIKALDLTGRGIENLEGLEDFRALEELELTGNLLTEVDVSQNTNLRILRCDGFKKDARDGTSNEYRNNIAKLNISGNTELTILDMRYSRSLGSLDVSSAPKLKSLWATYTRIVALDISNNNLLENLYLNDSRRLENVDVSNHEKLEAMFVANLAVQELDVSQNPNLEYFDCVNNRNLRSLNLNNGNNTRLISVRTHVNPKLKCIQVDDVEYSKNNDSWIVDDKDIYSEDCSSGTSLKSSIVSLYPNPAISSSMVKIDDGAASFTTEIVDLSGRVLKSYETSSVSEQHIDVSDLRKGVYIVRVHENGKVISKKLLVE